VSIDDLSLDKRESTAFSWLNVASAYGMDLRQVWLRV